MFDRSHASDTDRVTEILAAMSASPHDATDAAGGTADLMSRFVADLYAKADPSFVAAFTPSDHVALARRAYAFLRDGHGRGVHVDVGSWPGMTDDVAPTTLWVTMPDRSFIVDSVRAELRRHDVELLHLLHPILSVSRDDAGSIVEIGRGRGRTDEVLEVYVVAPLDQVRQERLREAVSAVLDDVVAATDDYSAMLARCAAAAAVVRHASARVAAKDAADESHREPGPVPDAPSTAAVAGAPVASAPGPAESAAFLEFLAQDGFVFLGYARVDAPPVGGGVSPAQASETLGILRTGDPSRVRAWLEPSVARLADASPNGREARAALRVTKHEAVSPVHRPARMDVVLVPIVDTDGRVTAGHLFLGLFTSKALATPVPDVPLLRRLLDDVLVLDGAVRGSHDAKQIVTLVGSMPRADLFRFDAATLHREVRTMMAVERERGVRVLVRDDGGDGVRVTVVMPRDEFDSEVRRKIQAALVRRFGARHVEYRLVISDDESQVRFHFLLDVPTPVETIDVAELERSIADIARPWSDRVRSELSYQHGASRAADLAARWLPVMDAAYRADVEPEAAARHAVLLDRLDESDPLVEVGRWTAELRGAHPPGATIEVFHRGPSLPLSDVVPILENFGLRVLEQSAHRFASGGDGCSLDRFTVTLRDGDDASRWDDRAGAVGSAVATVLRGDTQNDPLLRLVSVAGCTLEEVALLQAYRGAYAQGMPSISRAYVTDTLVAHATLAPALLDTYAARLDPRRVAAHPSLEAARADVEAADAAFLQALGSVGSLAADTVLRGLHELMQATVRSNAARRPDVLALKIASTKVSFLPEPKPMAEIYVLGPGVEGVHLRGGPVARGGIRWSERPEDVRTEVLGLMKTQMTKNAVIVPVGAKGGFVVRHLPTDRDAVRAEVERQYRAFVGALLDVTDDLRGDRVVHPEGIVVLDGSDPYLVVAADKGTATFSDVANEIATSRGFWLGDAFASGGSRGYDHKAEAITARGAWESVRRHFRDLGVDVLRDSVTVAGIGDMSGDVFGNGLSYAPTLKLVAAFDHRHVFLDPDPDPEASYAERRRLFALPRSSWDDYDRSVLSAGGTIVPRSAKRVPLTDALRALLQVEADTLSGPDVVRAILRMPVDLLWNGGIGTYVKSSDERHSDVGDAANDAVRVDGRDLRCRVVGEGGNLGFTQAGRIEAARAGIRLDTDAIHNVGGVDMSDREVNLKIALRPLVARGTLDTSARDDLVRAMTDEVAEQVLVDAARQMVAIGVAERRALRDPSMVASLHAYLEGRGDLDSEVEGLPSERQRSERLRAGIPYTRPELAVLLAYVKMGVQRRLLETTVPESPSMDRWLSSYFPTALRAAHPDAIDAHPLRREIVAIQVANQVVDRLGLTFVHRTMRDTGATPVDVLVAATMAIDLIRLEDTWEAIERADGIDTDARYDAWTQVILAVEGLVAWILLRDLVGRDRAAFEEAYHAPFARLREILPDVVDAGERRRIDVDRTTWEARGFTSTLAARLAVLPHLPSAVGAIDVARTVDIALDEAARRFYAVGERLRLGELRDAIDDLDATSEWERIATNGLMTDLRQAQRRLTVGVVRAASSDPTSTLETFLATIPKFLVRIDALWADATVQGGFDLARAVVLGRVVTRASLVAGARRPDDPSASVT